MDHKAHEDEGQEYKGASTTLYSFISDIADKAGISRKQIHGMLPVDGTTGQPQYKLDTWIRRMSDIRLDKIVTVSEYAELLGRLDISKAQEEGLTLNQQTKLEAALREVRGQMDRAALISLLAAGLVQPFFTVNREKGPAYSLEWMIKADHKTEDDLINLIRRWQFEAVNNHFYLFVTTYRVWLSMSQNSINPDIVVTMGPFLSQVAIGYGMFSEAIRISDYALSVYKRKLDKDPQYFEYIRQAEAHTLRAVAHGRLIDVATAEKEFESASSSIDAARGHRLSREPLFKKQTQVCDQTNRYVLRERVRMYSHIVLEELASVWSDLSKWAPTTIQNYGGPSDLPDIRALVNQYETECYRILLAEDVIPPDDTSTWEEWKGWWDNKLLTDSLPPIDWDTLARSYLLFFSDKKDGFKKAVYFSERAYQRGRKLSDQESDWDINCSALTWDSLDTTRILLYCATSEWDKADQLYVEYNKRIPPEDRRLTRRIWQTVNTVVHNRYVVNKAASGGGGEV